MRRSLVLVMAVCAASGVVTTLSGGAAVGGACTIASTGLNAYGEPQMRLH